MSRSELGADDHRALESGFREEVLREGQSVIAAAEATITWKVELANRKASGLTTARDDDQSSTELLPVSKLQHTPTKRLGHAPGSTGFQILDPRCGKKL